MIVLFTASSKRWEGIKIYIAYTEQRENHGTSRSTNGEGGDTTIPSPGRSPKQPLPGIGLHDPLHGRQACPESNSFTRGLVKYVPGRGYFRAFPSHNRDKFVISPLPPIFERLEL